MHGVERARHSIGLQEKLIVEVLFVVALLIVSVVSLVCLSSRLPVSSAWLSMTISGFKQVCMELPKILQVCIFIPIRNLAYILLRQCGR